MFKVCGELLEKNIESSKRKKYITNRVEPYVVTRLGNAYSLIIAY